MMPLEKRVGADGLQTVTFPAAGLNLKGLFASK
jgi:hypothetical protein